MIFQKKTWLAACAVLATCLAANAQTYRLGSGFTNGQTVTTCSGTFTDTGGALLDYTNNENYTVTFCSSTAQPIFFTFTAFDLEGGGACTKDYLNVYNGATTASPLIGTYCGATLPGTITGSGSCLTFQFISNGTYIRPGWSATIGCVDCGLAACSSFSTLQFSGPTQTANPAGLVGDIWRFPAVLTGYDALVEITGAVNSTAIANIDNPAGPVGAWSPEITLTNINGADSYIDWKITIVATGGSVPTNLPAASRITSYDVDGNASYREIHRHTNPNGYILNTPTELTIQNSPPYVTVLGSVLEHTGISNDDPVKVTFYYPGTNNIFNMRLGLRTTAATGSVTRQYAVSFDPCVSYANPDVTPVTPVITGSGAVCVNGANPTYSTTALFTAYSWSVTGGTIVSGQGTRFPVVDWTAAGNQVVSVTTTDANGCIVTSSFPVVVNANPTVTASNTGPYCPGATVQLYSSPSGGTAPYTYSWTGPLNFINMAQNPSFVAYSTAYGGTYIVSVADANGCPSTPAMTTVVVNASTAKPGSISY